MVNPQQNKRCSVRIEIYFSFVSRPARWLTDKCFADLAFIPLPNSGGRPPMIIELKYDKTADSAIRQIKERRYHGSLSGFGDEILLVGINYDKEDKGKKHTCIIESVSGNLSK